MNIKSRIRIRKYRQRGIVLLLVVVAMTSILGMAGLALDFGLAFLTKSRIQNALDAAALSGAKVLKATGNRTQAQTDAQAAFNYYLGQLNRSGGLTPTYEFGSTISPSFTAGPPYNFIRVRMPAGYSIPTYLTRVFPGIGNTLALSGSAVAGPIRLSPPNEFCNLVPIMVAVNQPPEATIDSNCSDGACYGYRIGEQLQLTLTESAGPGNFNFLRMGDLSLSNNANDAGARVLRENLAGEFNGCRTLTGDDSADNGNINTQPGRVSGPFKQGINTRFGERGGGLSSSDYPPDINTDPFNSYAEYKSAVASGTLTDPPPTGVAGRRLIRVVFSDVRTGGFNGATSVPITGFGCFFLLRPADGQGNGNDPVHIDAEFTNDCSVPNGSLSNEALNNQGTFFKIVLYKDPDSVES